MTDKEIEIMENVCRQYRELKQRREFIERGLALLDSDEAKEIKLNLKNGMLTIEGERQTLWNSKDDMLLTCTKQYFEKCIEKLKEEMNAA